MTMDDILTKIAQIEARQTEVPAFAVLVPLIKKADGWHVLFQVRAKQMHIQPGEVCFPGGHVELTDASLKHAAIRETVEELGINEADISNVAPLTYRHPAIAIAPFVGEIAADAQMNPDAFEVDSVFTIPLHHLLNLSPQVHEVTLQPTPNDDFPYHLIQNGRDYKWLHRKMTVYFYEFEDKVIWGLTADILKTFLDALK